MTRPRQVLEGATYLVTRRCSERRFFLRPSPNSIAIFRYVLAVAAERYGILLHAYCVLSNHFHLVLTDPHARLPEFHRDLDGLLARALNCHLGRWESFWDPDSYSAVRLETPEAVIEKMVYVLANPVSAGLVRHASQWPGLWSDPRQIGGPTLVAERPAEFFRQDGPMPAVAHLRLHPPPGVTDVSALVETLERQLTEAEDAAAATVEHGSRGFLGVARVLAQKPFARPAPGEPRRGLRPRVASRNKWKRVEALLRLAEFGRAYRQALDAWRAGVRGAVFPRGTWLMRVQHGVCCAGDG
jgi:REP element-mobilizing transposase RayT